MDVGLNTYFSPCLLLPLGTLCAGARTCRENISNSEHVEAFYSLILMTWSPS